jgi:lipoprotein-anchoring transpeptidase ErfK/SrfK
MRHRRFPLIVILALSSLLALAATAFAQDTTTTAPAPTPGIAPVGSTVAGVDISGQDAATALATVTNAYTQPIVVRIGDRVFKIANAQIAATADIQPAVTDAVNRTAAGNTPVVTSYNETKLQAAVDKVIKMASTKGSAASWKLTRTKPVLKLGKPGNAPDRAVIVDQVKRATAIFSLRAQQDVVPLAPVNTEATLEKLGYVIVVSKPSRTLTLWAPVKDKAKVVKQYRVAVGAPSFPTPSGHFTIVNMQKNPWWYPPSSDWAKGEQPVPPGPSNPLGTRWMGLDREDVGIHGTPDSGSIGGYASHGCVRMLISQAEALFNRVDVGTPVIIY